MQPEQSLQTKILKVLIKIVVFVVGLTFVIQGQKTVGYFHMGMMLVGLTMLLSLVYSYNKKYNV